ncbi:enoyl-CoA hydratase/isomerase family protein [Hugenholtzia roseola]|uniref:enoyl-CoA hydratase/isomerase family protein n=1 Tax=Hugenholtzia roseola TaxID=1002 RepID=UPI00040720A5|nr:enoyl-CoA hydratase-related protein [Hugenholtzia roseola]
MAYQNLLTQLKDGIFYITINRESKLNALNIATIEEINQVFTEVYDNKDIKGVILTGAGSKAFVAGADISEIAQLNEMHARKFAENGQAVFEKIENCPKPVLAAINGFALGGGCELAMACHLRFAAENAKFGQPEINLGIIPGYGGTQRLTQYVGKSKAMELTLTGNMFSAQEALAWGLLNYVYPQAELLEKAEAFMQQLTAKAPIAMAQIISSINAFYGLENGYQTEANAFANCCRSQDFKEGTSAFLEKRKAQFQGK